MTKITPISAESLDQLSGSTDHFQGLVIRGERWPYLSHGLQNAHLSECEFIDVDFNSANLRNAQIGGLDIREIDLTGVRILPWQQHILLETVGIQVCTE